MTASNEQGLESLKGKRLGESTLMELLTGEQGRESVRDVERSMRSGREEVQKALGQAGVMGLSIKDFSSKMVEYALDLDELNDEHKHLAAEWDTKLASLKNWKLGEVSRVKKSKGDKALDLWNDADPDEQKDMLQKIVAAKKLKEAEARG